MDGESNLYKLTCGQVVEDPFSLMVSWLYVNGMFFSTRDKDNDRHSGECSEYLGNGGGWFINCGNINFNGIYPTGPGQQNDNLLRWKVWKGLEGLKYFSMAIKVPRN